MKPIGSHDDCGAATSGRASGAIGSCRRRVLQIPRPPCTPRSELEQQRRAPEELRRIAPELRRIAQNCARIAPHLSSASLRHDAITATGTSSSSCVSGSCTWACCCSYTSRRPSPARRALPAPPPRCGPRSICASTAPPSGARGPPLVLLGVERRHRRVPVEEEASQNTRQLRQNCAIIAQPELRGVRRGAARRGDSVQKFRASWPRTYFWIVTTLELATVDQFLHIHARHVVERRARAPARVFDQLGVVLPSPREPRGRDVVACFLLPLQRHTLEGIPPPRPRVRRPALLRRRRRRPVQPLVVSRRAAAGVGARRLGGASHRRAAVLARLLVPHRVRDRRAGGGRRLRRRRGGGAQRGVAGVAAVAAEIEVEAAVIDEETIERRISGDDLCLCRSGEGCRRGVPRSSTPFAAGPRRGGAR